MAQVLGYHRPTDLEEALELLAQTTLHPILLAGGTAASASGDAPVTAVDLQALGLDEISTDGDRLRVGAMVRLQDLVDHPQVPSLLRDLARRELPSTLRSLATVGGTIGAGTWESELLAGLLAFEAIATVRSVGAEIEVPVSDVLLGDRAVLEGGIVTEISFSLDGNAAAARTGRTPADTPIVAVVGRRLPDGQMRIAMTGVAATPVMVDDASTVQPPADFRGSSEYRRALAIALSARVHAQLGA